MGTSDLSIGDGRDPAEAANLRVETTYRENYEKLWRAMFAFTHDADAASEAISEAFTQATGRGDAIIDLSAWIWKSCYRIASGILARPSFEPLPESLELSYSVPEPAWDLLNALADLPQQQRAIAILFYYCDLSTREIAEILDTTDGSARAQLHTARRRLRVLLEEK